MLAPVLGMVLGFIFMTITLWALVLQASAVGAVVFGSAAPAAADILNGIVALALFALAGLLIAEGGRALVTRPA